MFTETIRTIRDGEMSLIQQAVNHAWMPLQKNGVSPGQSHLSNRGSISGRTRAAVAKLVMVDCILQGLDYDVFRFFHCRI